MPVDWAATGSMVTGIGTIAGAGAVAFAAIVGRNTFASWKHQKIEERRMQLAEDILASCFRFQSALHSVRNPMHRRYEIEQARQRLQDNYDGFRNMAEERRSMLETAQVIISRFENDFEALSRPAEFIPITKALFSPKISDALSDLSACAMKVKNAATSYALHAGADFSYLSRMEARFWWGTEDDDDIEKAVSNNLDALKEGLIPILQSDSTNV